MTEIQVKKQENTKVSPRGGEVTLCGAEGYCKKVKVHMGQRPKMTGA